MTAKAESAPIGGRRDVVLATLSASSAAEYARSATERAGFPGQQDTFIEALEDRGLAQVEACAALPVKPDEYRADRAALANLDRLEYDLDAARQQRADLQDQCEDARKQLAQLPLPMDARTLMLVVVGQLSLSLVVGVIVGLLIASSVDAFLLRSYVASVLETDASRASALFAVVVSIGCAGSVVLAQSVTVLLTKGNIGWLTKLLFIVSDLLFSGGFALTRMSQAVNAQALAISAFEFAILLAHTIALIAIARILHSDHQRRQERKPLVAEHRSSSDALNEARKRESDIESRLNIQLHALEEREDAARRLEAQKGLMADSMRAEYLATTSELAAQAAKNPSADGLTDGLDQVIASRFASLAQPTNLLGRP